MSRPGNRVVSPLQPLRCRVLVVEDDYFVATELSSVLAFHGAEVLGPVSSVAESRRIIAERPPECVLLDINLRGESSLELAQELHASGIAVIFTSGYDPAVLPPLLSDTELLRKPVDINTLVERIRTRVHPALDA